MTVYIIDLSRLYMQEPSTRNWTAWTKLQRLKFTVSLAEAEIKKHLNSLWKILEEKRSCTGALRYFLSWYEYRISEQTHMIFTKHVHMYWPQTWESTLQLVLTLLLLFSPICTAIFRTNWQEKSSWAVFSIIFKMVDTRNTCVLPTRLVRCTDFWAHEQDMRRFVVM